MEDGQSYYIDGLACEDSNWLRYVNCARNEEEQNLIAFQHHGDIYYWSYRQIYPGTELLVWYGEEYARGLNIAIYSNQGTQSTGYVITTLIFVFDFR